MCAGCFFTTPGSGYSNLQRAEEFLRQKKFDQAIAAYTQHMHNRLAYPQRPEWENPYFYLLLIGDVHLHQGAVDAALTAYAQAEQAQVDRSLISDRYRSVARWYEQHNDLRSALALLERYRDRDPLLIDAMLDRLSKALTVQEEAAHLERQ
jgi:tetratricopeptide (TPR) repeat protein